MKKKNILRILSWFGIAVAVVWLVWGNISLQVERYTISDTQVPDAFSGYRIVHVSDLHNTTIGKGNSRLLKAIRDSSPDIIVITGDLIDSRRTNINVAFSFVREAADIAPVLYVSGNHEARLDYASIRQGLQDSGAIVLDNDQFVLEKGEESLSFLGLSDMKFSSVENMTTELTRLVRETEGYRILLCHRPQLFDIFRGSGIHLMLSGHAHGGQVRIPFVGGSFTLDQGIFPKYDSGLYGSENCRMLVSRGLGDSIISLRVANRHTLLVIDLYASD